MTAVNQPAEKSSIADGGREVPEAQIAEVLESRFGDGMVYLPRNRPRHLFDLAVTLGFIDGEGYLTRKGRALLARFHYA